MLPVLYGISNAKQDGVARHLRLSEEALVDVKNFAGAHEECNILLGQAGNPIIFRGDTIHMQGHIDYGNNYIGRQYILVNDSIREKKFLWILTGYEFVGPSDQTIRNVLKDMADNSECICSHTMFCIWNAPRNIMIRYADYIGGERIYCHTPSWE